MTFAPAPEYEAFPIGGQPLDFYEAVVHATRDTLPLVRELRPMPLLQTSSRSRPRSPRSSARFPRATLDPARLSRERAELSDLLARRAPAAHIPGRAMWQRAH